MELKVQEFKTPAEILFNYEELKQAITEKTKPYEMTVYTAEQIPAAKADRAMLNKLKKALNDDRLQREREYMKPFSDYKAKINELISIVDKGVKNIDGQIKSAEEKRKEDKLEKILHFLNDNKNIPEWLHIEQIFNEKWLNASVSMSTIEKELTARIEQIEKELVILREIPEFSFEATEEYKQSLDLSKAAQTAKKLKDMVLKKEEAERIQEAEKAVTTYIRSTAAPTNISFFDGGNGVAYGKADENAMKVVINESPKSWVSFKALLSTEDALALKQFFNERNITFEKI
jgi:hypothetical protein